MRTSGAHVQAACGGAHCYHGDFVVSLRVLEKSSQHEAQTAFCISPSTVAWQKEMPRGGRVSTLQQVGTLPWGPEQRRGRADLQPLAEGMTETSVLSNPQWGWGGGPSRESWLLEHMELHQSQEARPPPDGEQGGGGEPEVKVFLTP